MPKVGSGAHSRSQVPYSPRRTEYVPYMPDLDSKLSHSHIPALDGLRAVAVFLVRTLYRARI